MNYTLNTGPTMKTSTGCIEVEYVIYKGKRIGMIKSITAHNVRNTKTISFIDDRGSSHGVSGSHPEWLIKRHTEQ